MELPAVVGRAAIFAGLLLASGAGQILARYVEWLEREAVPAGLLGRDEAGRLWERHIADSLTFAAAWRGLPIPHQVVDLGTGAGLPGIPLAVAWPSTEFLLVERSARRCLLLRRAVRMLELGNAEVRQQEAASVKGSFVGVVARGLAPPAKLKVLVGSLLGPGGTAVIGGSHRDRPAVEGFLSLQVPPEILDPPSWLLIMREP